MTLPDLTDTVAWPDEELENLRIAAVLEQTRRQILQRATEEINEINRRYSEAIGRAQNDPWAQPEGAHDAYPLGWHVTHETKEWESLIPSNVWEPGVSGWREVVPAEAPPAEWVQPTGAHDAYDIGARVTYQGNVYESVINDNVWSPTDYPQGWSLVTP